MSQIINTTASCIKAILAFTDPEKTPKIAYEKDELAIPLINKLKESIGDKDGSLRVSVNFSNEEQDLREEMMGICGNISDIFSGLHHVLSA